MSEVDELHIHKKAFEKMHNLFFLKINKKPYKEVRWHMPKGFNNFPPKLKVLSWIGCPLRCLPSNFCPQHLVKLKMKNSNIQKLWEGVQPLTGLKRMDFSGSENLEELPDLSMATNLEKLLLTHCSSLVKITSSIGNLHKLVVSEMSWCTKLEVLPSGIDLKSLYRLNLGGCSRLRRFPDISSMISWLNLNRTTIEEFPSVLHLDKLNTLQMKEIKSQKLWEGVQSLSCLTMIDLSGSKKLKEIPNLMLATNLEWMNLSGCSSLVELPSSSIQNLDRLTYLSMENCTNLEVLPSGINLKSLDCLNLGGCSKLRIFPDISKNIISLILNQTAIEELPCWVSRFSKLNSLRMRECKNFKYKYSIFRILRKLKEVYIEDSGDPRDIAVDFTDFHSFFRLPRAEIWHNKEVFYMRSWDDVEAFGFEEGELDSFVGTIYLREGDSMTGERVDRGMMFFVFSHAEFIGKLFRSRVRKRLSRKGVQIYYKTRVSGIVEVVIASLDSSENFC